MVSLVGRLSILLGQGFSKSRTLEYTYLGHYNDAYLHAIEVGNFRQ